MARILEAWPALLGLIAGLFLYLKGRIDGQRRAGRKREAQALKTQERINNAPITTSLSDARDWLAAHADRLRDKWRP